VNVNLEIRDEKLFERRPGTMLAAFRRLQDHRDLVGFGPRTLRALPRACPDRARLPREPVEPARVHGDPALERLTWTLRRMSRYGVLGSYLPAFGRIVGQMQHDLFHVYTVDEHILMVIRNLRRFRIPALQPRVPVPRAADAGVRQARAAVPRRPLPRHRQGARRRPLAPGLAGRARASAAPTAWRKADADLVAWLVEHHLVMSSTAQKQDLGDPEVISVFATLVRDERTLTALYILTVADIRGTSPQVWNAWKGKLLEDLFRYTRARAARRADYAGSWIAAKKESGCASSASTSPSPAPRGALERLGRQLLPALRGERDRLAHAHAVEQARPRQADRARAPVARGRGLQVLVYAPDQPGLFARITGFFERLQFDVAAAKIYTTQHGFALDTFQVLSRTRAGEHYRDLIQKIERRSPSASPRRPARAAAAGARLALGASTSRSSRRSRCARPRPGRWLVTVSCADRRAPLARSRACSSSTS
jgi:[protein-PII] uridylyltransferase